MSAPLVVNTKDGTVWTRRGSLRGGEPLYAPQAICSCPEFVMATLAELAEHGIAGTADALPMPVGPEPQLTPERLAEIRDLIRYESSIAFYSHRAKESVLLLVEEAEAVFRLRGRVSELEAERHTTNEALSDAAEQLRANRDRIAELEQQLAAEGRPADEDPIAHALTEKAEADCDHPNGYGPYGCAGCGAFRPPADEEDVTPQVRKLKQLLAGQRDAVAAEAGERP